jgi:hypothetical protein
MGATAVKTERSAASFGSAEELRAVLERMLADVDADDVSGPLLRASNLRIRFEFSDVGLVLNTAASDDPHHHIRWAFSDEVDWEPALELTMDSETANRYLQGKESLPIAIARRKVHCRGESRFTLLFLPVLRLIVDPYRRAIRAQHPALALD